MQEQWWNPGTKEQIEETVKTRAVINEKLITAMRLHPSFMKIMLDP